MLSHHFITESLSLGRVGVKDFSDAGGAKPKNDILRRHTTLNQFSIDVDFGTVVLNPDLIFDDVKLHDTPVDAIFLPSFVVHNEVSIAGDIED
ncbi:hypothetical protein IQ269_20080 [Tychonema sp. LEGE 07199]|uniref:hypothetical protein n=1 Tax=unclassified Tychonema TaxID=2642144 RepID=UPI00187E9FD0|nr:MULTISPECIES: hypothetical protein [unclassified Tychonema]MBE9123034.1 hypothetical protein [Tychonema sp. LEGE 07199]MBE9134374.1 hypothetical protein [Tychonema sp. LEGE 07196]